MMTTSRLLVASVFVLGCACHSLWAEHPLPGPHFLNCEAEGDTVHLSWDTLGLDPANTTAGNAGAWIERDGIHIANLAPGDVSYDDIGVEPGPHTYRLVLVLPDGQAATVDCEVIVEMGVRCAVQGDTVTIDWEVSSNILALGFIVVRDNEVIATLGPEARSHTDQAPPGEHVYTVGTNNSFPGGGPPDFLIGSCVVLVGGNGLPAPQDLFCAIAESFPVQPQLLWANPVAYDAIGVVRDGQVIAQLPGDATFFSEFDPGAGQHLYGVFGMSNGVASATVTCILETPGPGPFHRLSLVNLGGVPGDPNTPGGPNSNGVPGDPAGGVASGSGDTVAVVLENRDPVQGWSFGVCSDASVLVVEDATLDGTVTAGLNEGAGPSFLALDVLEGGVIMAVVIDDHNPADVLPPGSGLELLKIRYGPGPDAQRGVPYSVAFCAQLGAPPVAVVLVVEGQEVFPLTSPGVVIFAGRLFLRADVNSDGTVDMSDGIAALEWLFRSGPQPTCVEAADANGSFDINIADAIFLFQALFGGGQLPPSPFPDCGSMPLNFTCEASSCE